MSKSAFDKIAAGLTDAVAIARGEADPSSYVVHIPAEIDVKAIRGKLGMTQAAFAKTYGLPAANIRDWEQGRRMPDQSARVLLKVIAAEPEAVARALAVAS
jgi:putative transcriptional regulator